MRMLNTSVPSIRGRLSVSVERASVRSDAHGTPPSSTQFADASPLSVRLHSTHATAGTANHMTV
jgi:hypothetical protein